MQMHLTSVVESLIRNDRGAWNLGSSVVVQIQVETHQMIKVVMRVSLISGCLMTLFQYTLIPLTHTSRHLSQSASDLIALRE